MNMLIDLLSWFCLTVGGVLMVIGGIGILRFPDFFTRLHAASVTDTLCTSLIMLGLMLQAGLSLIALKLLVIVLFVFLTSPTSSHALAKTAIRGGLVPLRYEDDP